MSEFRADGDFERLSAEAEYVCPACGELIVVPVDPSAGQHQEYVEDCPICCRPLRLRVDWDAGGFARISCEAE